jgi:hypothetical protein
MTGWRILALTLLATMVLVTSSCGDIAFKTGADATQLRQDKEACKASADAAQCMKDKGWAITRVEDDSPKKSAADPAPQEASRSPVAPTDAVSASLDAPPAPEPQADPLRLVAISGWAKFGGGSPDVAIAECVASLGPAHRPDSASHQITAALLACMRAKHWRAL